MKITTASIALIAIMLCSSAIAQNHAILPEQCRADVHLWKSRNKTENDKLSYDDLQRRSTEMWNCQSIDTGTDEAASEYGKDLEDYRLLWTGYTSMKEQRLQNFLVRHSLVKQFVDEDAAGQR
jgi:hypothetical protein